jgi:DNA-binding Xre family transcriptional regulator
MLEATRMAARFRLQEILDAQDPPISQSELARRSGVSLVTINAIANNRTKQVQLETLDKLALALGLQPGELLERESKRRGKR